MSKFSLQSILDSTLSYRKIAGRSISNVILTTGIIFFSVFIFDLGFEQDPKENAFLFTFYRGIRWVLLVAFIARSILNIPNINKSLRSKVFDLTITILLLLTFRIYHPNSHLHQFLELFPSYKYLFTPVFSIAFIAEFSRSAVNFYSRSLNPHFVVVFSFIAIILIGSVLLSLPNSTTQHVSLIDIIFTSTAAVCVTGSTVIDISTDLTLLGQLIILCLIQIGGLGILTFVSFIGFIISGKRVSFQQRLVLRELANTQRMNDVIHAVYKIVSIMFIVEALGAIMIYSSVPSNVFDSKMEQVFFAIFHSVSAFCNSGLSNFPDGLHFVDLRYSPLLLLNISFLIIIGGIGFPIMLNFYDFLKQWTVNIWNYIVHKKRFVHMPYFININSRIILYTTVILLAVGWLGSFIFEYNNTLAEYSLFEKSVVSFFTSVTTRTAGFNVMDMSTINFPTYLLFIFLMWIGASPGGTGGGVKTTTFSVMVLNFWSLAKGKNQLIIQNRRIKNTSINKSFAIIFASLIWIGLSVFLILSFDPKLPLEKVVFEVFSTFSNTGLSQGITRELSGNSKFILITLMLIGRVGSIAFLSVFLYRSTYSGIKYPHQEVNL